MHLLELRGTVVHLVLWAPQLDNVTLLVLTGEGDDHGRELLTQGLYTVTA